MGQSMWCSILFFNLIFGYINRTIGGVKSRTTFVLMSQFTSESLSSIKNYRRISQSSEIVAITTDDTTCSYLMDNFKNDSLISCAKCTTVPQLIHMAKNLPHNKVCVIVESSQLSYLPTNSVEDFDESYVTFYYGDSKPPSLKPYPSLDDGTTVNIDSSARYVMFSKDSTCAPHLEGVPTPLIASPYKQNAIINQLFSYLSSQKDCEVKRSTIVSNSGVDNRNSFHNNHRDLLTAPKKAALHHRHHHSSIHRHFSTSENGSVIQITDLSNSLADPSLLKDTLASSVHPTGFIFVVTVNNVRSADLTFKYSK